MGLKGQNDPVLVLNAKGGEIKAKANGLANHLCNWISQPLVNFKNSRVRICILSKYSYCKIWSLMGENFDYGKKGEFLALDKFFHWNISLCAQTSESDLEIGK